MGKDVFPLFTIMSEWKSDAPLLLSVFLVLFNHTGPFLDKRLELKKFRAPPLERGATRERGGKRQDCSLLEFFFLFFCVC